MDFELLDDITKISESFISQFVMSWECFQIKQKDWIDKMDKAGYPIDNRWYNQAYMWDRMDPKFPRVTMQVAMAFLRKHQGNVMFMTEKGEKPYFQGKKSIDYVAKVDAVWLADRIEQEWYSSYDLSSGHSQSTSSVLPDDLYVFDSSMTWCVVFTHEATSEEAESRYCIICQI